MKAATFCLLAFSLCVPAFAGGKHAPLPEKLVSAKTVFIDNRTGYAEIGDKAYQQVTKSGQFQVVTSSTRADVVFLFTASTFTGSYTTDGRIDDNGRIQSETVAQNSGQTVLTVIDPNSSQVLWADSKVWGGGSRFRFINKSATKELVKELCKRIAEQSE